MTTLKVLNDLHITVFEAIDNVDDNGFLYFLQPKDELDIEPGEKQVDIHRRLIDLGFHDYRLPNIRLRRVKKWVRDIDADHQVLPNGDWVVSFDFARFMLLPCENPLSELMELRGWLELVKTYYEKLPHPDSRPVVGIECSRKAGPVFGTVFCDDESVAPCFQAALEATPTLRYFLRQAALTLQKLGPGSCWGISEDVLFPYMESPRMKRAFADFQAKKAASTPAL